MSLINKFGQKHVQLLGLWAGSAAVFGATATSAMLYFTEWKVVLKYLPIYNTKFPVETEETK